MKLLAGIGALGLLGGGLYASDALTAGTVYDKPYAKAYADLADMPILPLGQSSSTANGSMVVERKAGAIGWRISLGPVEVGRFTAQLTPVGTDHTRVVVEFVAAPTLQNQNPILTSDLMTDFARLAMVEQVDARMENRAPDLREIHWAAARHLQAHPEQLKQFGVALQNQFKSVNEMLRSEKTGQVAWDMPEESAVDAPPPGSRDVTKPTTDLSRFN